MQNNLLLLFLVISGFSALGQMETGRFFKNIEGTTWISQTAIDSSTLLNKENFNLTLYEGDIDRLSTAIFVVQFDSTMTVNRFRAETNSFESILTCSIEHNKDWRSLSFFIDDRRITYSYIFVSTGNYVQLFETK